jgi:Putative MetA-pathway of phenol degradation
MNMKTTIMTFGIAMTVSAFAGTPMTMSDNSAASADGFGASNGFANARRPISNPTLFDLAVPRSNVHPIVIHQSMPSIVRSGAGGPIALGGDFQLYAVQFEYAFHDRLSLVATKDGYVDFNPENTLADATGFANLAAGLKYAFIYQPENQFALSGTATVEIPTGSSSVTQGSGDGAVNLIVSALKLNGSLQLAGGAGVHLPIDADAGSTTSFVSTHISYEVNQFFTPLLELNWYHVLAEGDGGNRFKQIGGALPGVIGFEGGDLLNWGASNAGENADIVTLAAGFRSKLNEDFTLGLAYEIPLTNKEENLMENRITLDLLYHF